MEPTDFSRAQFARNKLPWILCGLALLLYLSTLHRWVTVGSLSTIALITGWDWWTIDLSGPLYLLVTLPLRLLPETWEPLGLNALAAVCAASTLALLTRSIALLPQDRTREQRQRERSESGLVNRGFLWIPPVLGTLVLGLQSTFWEHATVATGEMFNLLVFAYVIRCLLEYRLDQRESWMNQVALVYGLGMANNWAMIGFFPLFLIALIWLRGKRFFETRFLLRMVGFGGAGLSLILLLPLLEAIASEDYNFWQLLMLHLTNIKNTLGAFPKWITLLCAMVSIVPLALAGIRWPSMGSDVSAIGAMLTHFLFRIVHLVFLVACLWIMFDPPFSPRAFAQNLVGRGGGGIPLLTFYYLAALAVGYFSGYFLVIYGIVPEKHRGRGTPPLTKAVARIIPHAAWILALILGIALVQKNYSAIQQTQSQALSHFARLVAKDLPESGAVVLSDDPNPLLLLQGWFALQGRENPHMLIDNRYIQRPYFHHRLEKHYPELWTAPEKLTDLNAFAIAQRVLSLREKRPVYYLQPSSGYYLETSYLEPHNLVYRLVELPSGTIDHPDFPPALIQENQEFWNQLAPQIQAKPMASSLSGAKKTILDYYYSRGLNFWGVMLQRNKQLVEAGERFQQAFEINSDNVAAEINLLVNQNLQNGEPANAKIPKDIEAKFGKYRSWEGVLDANGPFDEPDFCFQLGRVFTQGLLFRQAAEQFKRSAELDPFNIEVRLWLGGIYSQIQMHTNVLEVTSSLRQDIGFNNLAQTNQVELLRLEAWANFRTGETNHALSILTDATNTIPNEPRLLKTLGEIYLAANNHTNAMHAFDHFLRLSPEDPAILLNQGGLLITLEHFDRAIATLNKLLEEYPNHYAGLRNRALAYLRSQQYQKAIEDYQSMLEITKEDHVPYYGLAEVAMAQNNTNEAIEYYQKYLEYAPPDTEEAEEVQNRLDELQGASSAQNSNP